MLSDEELLRYSRHILLTGIDVAGQLQLKQSRVLIVGLGGLGSPASLYLAAAGIGELHLADFDRVDSSNLQRQIVHTTASAGQLKVDSAKERLQALNPLIQVQVHSERLGVENLDQLVQGMDLVLDCTDNFRIRDELNEACCKHQVPWLSAAAIGFNGQLTLFDSRQADSPCYRCLFSHGSEENPDCNSSGVLGPLVGVIGSLQAGEAIKFLTSTGQSLLGRLLLVDMSAVRFRELAFKPDPGCPVCGKQA